MKKKAHNKHITLGDVFVLQVLIYLFSKNGCKYLWKHNFLGYCDRYK